MRLLVTRPDPQGEQTVAALHERGHEVTSAPLLKIETQSADFGDARWTAIAVTSANAIRAIASHSRLAEISALPVFAVGNRTAQAAQEIGFTNVISAEGDADALAALVAETLPPESTLLYLAGEDRAGDLAAGDAPVVTVVAYRAVKVQHFAPEVAAALARREVDGVLHFSTRSAQAYLDCASRDGILDAALAPLHVCISRQVAQPLAAAGAAAIRIAPRPDESAMIELVGRA